MRRFDASEPWRAPEPCVEVRFPVEGKPTVIVIAFSDEDEKRIRLWLEERPDLAQLVEWCAESSERGVETIQSIIWDNLHRGSFEEAA